MPLLTLRKLALPMIGIDDEADPPWDHLRTLFNTSQHVVAAIAILSASIQPYMAGDTDEVTLVAFLLFLQVTMRATSDMLFRRRATSDPVSLWFRRFAVISLLSGIVWGVSLAILYAGSTPDTQVVVLAIG